MLTFEYDTEERLICITNQRGERYRIDRDALGRIVKEVDYWGKIRKYNYTQAGFLKEIIDPLGRISNYETDPLGRIVQKTHRDQQLSNVSEIETFDYDPNGNLVACENSAIKIEREFDEEGRLIREAQGEGFEINNQYDCNGNRLTRVVRMNTRGGTYASTIRYGYDLLDQVISVDLGGASLTSMKRDGLGRISAERLGAQIVRVHRYDPDSLLMHQGVGILGRPIFNVEYEYDRLGNLKERRDSILGTDGYDYDSAGQLTVHTDAKGRRHEYRNDPAGDRLLGASPINNEEGTQGTMDSSR